MKTQLRPAPLAIVKGIAFVLSPFAIITLARAFYLVLHAFSVALGFDAGLMEAMLGITITFAAITAWCFLVVAVAQWNGALFVSEDGSQGT